VRHGEASSPFDRMGSQELIDAILSRWLGRFDNGRQVAALPPVTFVRHPGCDLPHLHRGGEDQ
jgi:hypothetical protein